MHQPVSALQDQEKKEVYKGPRRRSLSDTYGAFSMVTAFHATARVPRPTYHMKQ